MRFVKDFVFGAFYLISGIYSIGFSLMLVYTTRPVSGNPAFFTATDRLFPFEVGLFVLFGAIFVAAAAYHFIRTVRASSLRGLAVPP